MNASRFSRIIGKCPRKLICDLVHPIMGKYEMQVLRNPATTLVMVQMRETVTGARFYLGELLASEAMVQLAGSKGFALLVGDDLDRTLCAAALDALRRSSLPEWVSSLWMEELFSTLSEAEQQIEEAAQQEMRRHAASRVQFNTLDADK